MNEKKTRWLRLEEVGSTNDYAKAMRHRKEDTLITAKRQTGGRGTKGRSFSSGEGGLYLSKLSFYENFPAKEAFLIMVCAATAVCETLALYGFQPTIKWPNDIHVSGKKICGILIENAFSGAFVSSSVVGIGLNINNVLPDELTEIATTMQKEGGQVFSVEEVAKRLAAALEKKWTVQDYKNYLGYVGERVTLLCGEEKISALLLGVDEEGKLQAEVNGEKKVLSSAEVSLRV